MDLRKIKFGDKEVNKKEFYSSKQATLLDSVNLDKIVVSNKYKINNTTYKHICGYLNNDTIQPLRVILPQMDVYIKYFDDGGKNMSFVTDDEKIYEKYHEIWEVTRNLSEINFTVNPIRDYKYLVAKLKIFDRINRTTFNNNSISMEKKAFHLHSRITALLKIDKRAYPQAYLEQFKYKLKKRKIVNYINDEIVDEDSDSDIDDAIDSYVKI